MTWNRKGSMLYERLVEVIVILEKKKNSGDV
jgi:hypothetical protein